MPLIVTDKNVCYYATNIMPFCVKLVIFLNVFFRYGIKSVFSGVFFTEKMLTFAVD